MMDRYHTIVPQDKEAARSYVWYNAKERAKASVDENAFGDDAIPAQSKRHLRAAQDEAVSPTLRIRHRRQEKTRPILQ